MSDYRNTEYCNALGDIKKKKEEFRQQIINEHPKILNYYNHIKDKDGPYKLTYIKLYNGKCSYCGNSLDNISIDLFEIDHYINEASFKDKEKIKAHQIDNLVPACQICNRGKSGINIKDKYVELLHPDGDELRKVFYRDDNYKICISKQFESDPFIKNFYDALDLGKEPRRLDFLLLKMRGLCSSIKEENKAKYFLAGMINELQAKRNRIY